ncbi:MAG: hypothetical protein ACKO4Q_19650, partial [Planctomycetota bacterium]
GRFMEKMHGHVSEQMFEHFTIEALRAVDKRVCDVSVDGTVIAAATSRYHRLGAEAIARHRAQAQARVEAQPDDPEAKEALAKAKACAEALAAQQEARVAGGRDPSSVVIFPCEPDAVLHKTKEGGFHPAFVTSATATPERMIVGLDVNPRDEFASVAPMLEQACTISAKVAETRAPEARHGPKVHASEATLDEAPTTSNGHSAGDAGAASSTTPRMQERGSYSPPAHTITVARADSLYLAKRVLDLEERFGIELRIAVGGLRRQRGRSAGLRPEGSESLRQASLPPRGAACD